MLSAHVKPPKSLPYRARLAAVVSAALLGALLIPSGGQAASPSATDPDDGPVATGISRKDARALVAMLGESRTGGVYLDDSGRAVVAVTDEAAAQTVRAAGGVPELATYSTATLRSIHADLDKPGIPGTAWGVDPKANRVSVTVDSTVTGGNLARLKAATKRFAAAIKVERLDGAITPTAPIRGGDKINDYYDNGFYCSLGFNVQKPGGNKYFLTAGHCADGVGTWYHGPTYLGPRTGYTYGETGDYAIADHRNSDVSPYGVVNITGGAYIGQEQQITHARNVDPEDKVARSGKTSYDTNGKVLTEGETVTYADGTTVRGLVKTTLCTYGGDSGGPVYWGTAALGLTSGALVNQDPANNYCRTWHQPVVEVLNAYGVDVY